MSRDAEFGRLITTLKAHDVWMAEVVSLIASENLLSPAAKRALTSDMGNRVAEGWLGERIFPGLQFYDEVEAFGIRLVQELFNAPFVDIRPISGTVANMVVFSAATVPGDTIMAVPVMHGGHVSMSGATPRNVFNLRVIGVPMLANTHAIDVVNTVERVQEVRPALVVLGGSVILQPQPVREIVEVAHSVSAKVLFDASHVAGLIAGDCFPNPIDAGVDFMTFSTCKTIPGPQHAVVTARDCEAAALKSAVFPGLQSGHHLAETVSAVVTLAEFRSFGRAYATQTVNNAAALRDAMLAYGFEVEETNTHMVMTRLQGKGKAKEAVGQLAAANVLVNANPVPGDRSFKTPSGLRIGGKIRWSTLRKCSGVWHLTPRNPSV
jgi:glycine hydroxymethyltransferase